MANELKLAKAAREIARELSELPEDARYPFGIGHVFRGEEKAPCCVVGHVIHRAGLSGLVRGRPSAVDGKILYRHSGYAIADICGKDHMDMGVELAICDVVDANDYHRGAPAVAGALYQIADLLEVTAATSNEEA